jgi:hypothetical protein
MEKRMITIKKTKDGEAGLTYALVWPGEEPTIHCEITMYLSRTKRNYYFKYTGENGETTNYSRNLKVKTREEGSDLIKRLLTQKAEIMSSCLDAELKVFDDT